MSIQDIAKHVQAHGRGNDTQLMHVTPKELGTLRTLAQSHGGDLTTNPHTGLPEAGFLDSLLPTLVGAGVGIATGNPFIGAAVGGGLGMATSGGNLQSGIIAGLGSYGFGSLGAGLAASGGEALAAEATPAAIDAGTSIAGQTANGIGAGAWSSDASLAANAAAPSAVPGYTPAEGALNGVSAEAPAPSTAQDPSTWDKLTKGFQATKFDSDYLKKNMFPLGLGAAGLLMGNQSSSAASNPVTTQQTPYVRPFTYSKTMNPNWQANQQTQPYFNQSMMAGTPIAAADTVGQPFFAAGGLTQNAGYPMAQQDPTQYATSTQMPVGAMAMNADYDTPTNPETGTELPRMASGGLGSYSDGGHLLRGPGDGISDSIPASIGGHQPARLANNEFVIPARIVSEIGNGSTDAGAKRLYDMMAKVQARRKKTVGSGNIAVDSGAHKELNRL